MSTYNMNRRTNYGIQWHERELIKRLEEKLSRATSVFKRSRYCERIRKAKARLLYHLLTQS